MVARSAALVLHVDIAFILLPVCRNFVTIVRNLPLKKVLPIDEAIQFRKRGFCPFCTALSLTGCFLLRIDKFAAWSIIFFTAVQCAQSAGLSPDGRLIC